MSNSRVSTWSGIRNKLENDYLCPALRGHIQYFATSYSKSADHEGRAAIRVDGVEVLRSNYYTYFENVWTKFHHLRSTTLKDHDSAKEAINQAHAYALEQGTFDQKVFYEAFGIFDNQSIEKSLVSENPLVRIFALLDRRLGKRRLPHQTMPGYQLRGGWRHGGPRRPVFRGYPHTRPFAGRPRRMWCLCPSGPWPWR